MSDKLTSLPYVPQANYAKIRDGLHRLEEAVDKAEDNRTALSEALDDGISPDMEQYVRDDMERAEQMIADTLATLVCDFTNVMLDDPQDRLARGLAREHPTLLANVLRATLAACRMHPHDGRLPEWARTEHLPVPTV